MSVDTPTQDLASVVDDLAIAQAELSLLTEKVDSLKSQLIASGLRQVPGTMHKVSISHLASRISHLASRRAQHDGLEGDRLHIQP